MGEMKLEKLQNFSEHIEVVSWALILPNDKMVLLCIPRTIKDIQYILQVFSEASPPKIVIENYHVFLGGLQGPQLQYNLKWPCNFDDNYGTFSSNVYLTPLEVPQMYRDNFVGFNEKDYCPVNWHPGLPFLTDNDIENGVFINPPFNINTSQKTGMGAYDHAQKFFNQKTAFTVMIRHANHDPISKLEKLPHVFTVYFEKSFPFLDKTLTPYKKPAHFTIKILHFGFLHGRHIVADLKDFVDANWLDKLTPTKENTVFYPRKQSSLKTNVILDQLHDRQKQLLKKSSFWEAKLPEEDLEMLPDKMAALFEKPFFPKKEMDRWHTEQHPDFFNCRLPPRLRKKPLKILKGLGAKSKFLKKISKSSNIHRNKHKLCAFCLHYGHIATSCPEKLPKSNFTNSQQALVDFIWNRPVVVVPPFSNPTAKQMFEFLDSKKEDEIQFWKDFREETGYSKESVDFKRQMFGNFQSNLAFWLQVGIPKAIVIHLIRGIDFHENTTPPRLCTLTKWSDPKQIEWLQNWKTEALNKGIIVPIPEECIHVCENIFLVNWDDDTKKTRLIWDGRLLNEFLTEKSFKLPLIHDTREIFSRDGKTVGTDATSAFSLAPCTPEQMQKCCFCIPQIDGTKKFFAYTGPPFGLSQVPRVFQKIMGAIKNTFARLGFPAILYIDDLEVQICKKADQEALRKSEWFFHMMKSFGVIYNKKSHYIPTSTFKYLGHIVDLETQTISPTCVTITKLFAFIETVILQPRQTLSFWQKFIGKINSVANSSLTMLLIRQLSTILQVPPDTSKMKKLKMPDHCLELIFVWLQLTTCLNVKKYNFSKKLHCHTVDIFTAKALVSDASEDAVGAFTLNPGIDIRFEGKNAGQISQCFTVSLPDDLQGPRTSSTRRELWGIKKSLEIAVDHNISTTAPAVALICDCKPAILGLIRGKSPEVNCNKIISEIHLILAQMKIPYTFVWTRRDHRAPTLADAFSKPWLFKNPYLQSFRNVFVNIDKKLFFSLQKCFSIPNPTVRRISKFLDKKQVNILCLPYTSNHLKKWLKVLGHHSIHKHFTFICVVPNLWSTPHIHHFIRKFAFGTKSYDKILKHKKHLPTTEATLCTNMCSKKRKLLLL